MAVAPVLKGRAVLQGVRDQRLALGVTWELGKVWQGGNS